MAIRSVAQLKAWFKRGKYPTAEQFSDFIDSYFHKTEDKIPISTIEQLPEQLNGKYDSTDGKELERKHDVLRADFDVYKIAADKEFNNIHTNLEELEAEDMKIWEDITTIRKDIENNSDVIIIPVDFTTLTYVSDIGSLADSLPANSIFEKPVYLKYIWKEDYITPDAPVYTCLIAEDYDLTSDKRIIFNSPIKVTEIAYPDEPYAFRIELYKLATGGIRIRCDGYKDEDPLIFTLPILPRGTKEGQQISFSAPEWSDLKYAVNACLNNQKYLLFFRDGGIVCPAYLTIKSGTVVRNNKIIEISGIYHLPAGNSIVDYAYRIVSEEFAYSEKSGLSGVLATSYLYENEYSRKVFTLTSDNDFNITNPQILDDYIAERSAGKNPVLLLKKSDFQLLTPSSVMALNTSFVALFDMHSTPIKNQESDLANNKMSYTMLCIGAIKNGNAWVFTVTQNAIQIDIYDYLKVSNIHLVTAYPTDLSTYPEGSIFIKQQV